MAGQDYSPSVEYPLITGPMLANHVGQYVRVQGVILTVWVNKRQLSVSVMATGVLVMGMLPAEPLHFGPKSSFVTLVGRAVDRERIAVEKAEGVRLNDVGLYKEPHDSETAPFRTKIRGHYLRKIVPKRRGHYD
ncbi:hypothetical protein C8R47DRAFT_1066472 [Mycena vitilis]|nr:hypothetical protein C8R47DRAFT_1066472 [Mycena vitilis]